MAELHEILASPLEVVIRGKAFRISPLSDADRAELLLWIRARFLDLAKQAAKDEPAEVKKEVLSQAIDKAFGLNFCSPQVEELLTKDVEAISYLFWLSLRHEHPQMTRQDVLQLSGDPEVLNALSEKLDIVTDMLVKKNRRSRRQGGQSSRMMRWSIGSWLKDMVGRRRRSGA